MKIEETHSYLLRIREIDCEITQLNMKCDAIRRSLLLSRTQYDKPAVQTSHENKMGSVTASVCELNEAIYRLRLRKAELIIEIGNVLDLLLDERESAVLTAYYISGMKMNKIAERIEYTASHTYRLQAEGVKHLSEILTASHSKKA